MRLEIFSELTSVLQGLRGVIHNHPEYLVYLREGEKSPDSIELDWKKRHIIPRVFKPAKTENLCTACPRRISYKPYQFTPNFPEIPLLVVVQNHLLVDNDNIYHEASTAVQFQSIFTVAFGGDFKKFLYREALRCHFSKADATNQEYRENCSQHVRKDIDNFRIRGIIFLGGAAPLFYPDPAGIKDANGKILEYYGIPALFSHGPERMAALVERKTPAEKIQAEKEQIIRNLKNFYGITFP